MQKAASELESVGDLALNIEERSRGLQRKPKWRQQPEEVKNGYEQVMKELADMKQEMGKLKVDMARVLKEKRDAQRSLKASNSKRITLLASMELMKKELDEEQTSDHRKETQLAEALQLTLFDINLPPINTITQELEGAKRELSSVKGEAFKFMTSMDVIQAELNHVRAELDRLRKAEEKQGLTVQNLNSKMMRAKAKLESLTSSEAKTNTIVSNLALSLAKLQAEAETAKKDEETMSEEVENIKAEIHKTEFEIDLVEDKLEAALEELETIKSSESKSMENLRNMIKTTRDSSSSSLMMKITDFEYEYLIGKAGQAAVLADKKIAAAEAWVEALKASEKELMMKIEMTQRDISDLSIEVDVERVAASPRRSVGKFGSQVAGGNKVMMAKRPKLRYSNSREKVVPSLKKLFSKINVENGQGS